jgi:hypothetical protein
MVLRMMMTFRSKIASLALMMGVAFAAPSFAEFHTCSTAFIGPGAVDDRMVYELDTPDTALVYAVNITVEVKTETNETVMAFVTNYSSSVINYSKYIDHKWIMTFPTIPIKSTEIKDLTVISPWSDVVVESCIGYGANFIGN